MSLAAAAVAAKSAMRLVRSAEHWAGRLTVLAQLEAAPEMKDATLPKFQMTALTVTEQPVFPASVSCELLMFVSTLFVTS